MSKSNEMEIGDALAKYMQGMTVTQVQRKRCSLTEVQAKAAIKSIGAAMVAPQVFKVDAKNRDLYLALTEYFMANNAFDKRAYSITYELPKQGEYILEYGCSLHKGILIMGGTGTGKTDALRIFGEFAQFAGVGVSMQLVSCRHMEDEFKIQGYDSLRRYKVGGVYLFDDIGEEDKVAKFYKDETNIFSGIITDRYNAWKRNGLLTFGTTNLNGTMLYERYGERTFERICEMFNIFKLTGDSRRPVKRVKK